GEGSTRGVYLNQGGSWSSTPDPTWVPKTDLVMHDCGNEEFDNGVRLVDINGDHLPDLVQSVQPDDNSWQINVWLNTGNGWGNAENPSNWRIPEKFVAIYIVDFGGGVTKKV